ncbi:ABC transporter permease, partial [Streptomyces sp. SID2131]|nr:ABC transporter permease [Streptomyces sp. SID2131]
LPPGTRVWAALATSLAVAVVGSATAVWAFRRPVA